MPEEYKTTFNYLLTHMVIPRMMFSNLDFFYETILSHPKNVQIFLQNAAGNAAALAEKNPDVEPAYPIEKFDISIFGDSMEKSVVMAVLPKCEKDCDCIAIAFPIMREHARYFTCELSFHPLNGEAQFLLCEWAPSGDDLQTGSLKHSNYGPVDLEDKGGFPARVAGLVYG